MKIRKICLSLALMAMVQTVSAATDTLTVRIKGMRCEECAHKVKNVLGKLNGIEGIRFNIERRTASVAYDPQKTSEGNIKECLAATGRYKASPYNPTEVIHRGIGLQMADMHCQNCANRIMKRLQAMEGIDSMAPHLDKHYMFIRYDANRTSKADIRKALGELGYTPVNYYTSKNISFAYFKIPAEQVTEETVETVLAMDGVDDANVNARQRSLAITYVNTETNEQRLLDGLVAEGIKAVVPKPHECKEEKEKNQ